MRMGNIVSIIILTYNRPLQLEELLYSLTLQTFQQFEVIVINNNGRCVKDVTRKFELDIHYINHPENHFVKTRNIAIEKATSEWIMFIDDDDIIHPRHIQKMIENKDDGSFFYSDVEILQYSTQDEKRIIDKITPYTYRFSTQLMTQFNMVILTGCLIKKSVFDTIGPLDVDAYNYWDWDLALRTIQSFKITRIPSPTGFYFMSKEGKNTSDTSAGDKRKPFLDYLCQKHAMHELGTENFFTMLENPTFEDLFDPQEAVFDGNKFWEAPPNNTKF